MAQKKTGCHSCARKYSNDPRFVFGTGKIGELAAYTSAILLIVISFFIFYEGITRLLQPKEINYLSALFVAFIGLSVNVASGLLLSCSCGKRDGEHGMHHNHSHGHSHGHATENYDYNTELEHTETFHIKVRRLSKYLKYYVAILIICFFYL